MYYKILTDDMELKDIYPQAINKLLAKEDLDSNLIEGALANMLNGSWTEVQSAAFLVAMRAKHVSYQELVFAARYLLSIATPISLPEPDSILDTAGTGGDGQKTFNISTAASFVAAAAGARVAKHGNRAMSGTCGSSDVLVELGANLNIDPKQTTKCFNDAGICFMSAPAYHPALKQIAPVRKQLGMRSMFNLLGPIINPAHAGFRLAGIYDPAWLVDYAEVFRSIGTSRAVVVHAGGLDEFALHCPSRYALMIGKEEIIVEEVMPSDVGLKEYPLEKLVISNPQQAAAMFNAAIDNKAEAPAAAVAFNAGGALLAAGIASTLKEGVLLAQEALANGKAREKFNNFVETSSSL